MIQRGLRALRDNGVGWTLRMAPRALYNQLVRQRLPKQTVDFNGVTVATHKLLDTVVWWHPSSVDRPSYETGLCAALRDQAQAGDDVVIIGGGWGVSTVVAARQVGPDGTVHTFEASEEFVPHLQDTAARNDVADTVTVYAATVVVTGDLYGSDPSVAETIPTDDLPAADVMVIDAEGAEQEILDSLSTTPRVLIVESHGVFGSPTDTIRSLLAEHGYNVIDEQVSEDWSPQREKNLENDVMVLTGVRR